LRPITVTVGPLANSSANGISTSQTPIAGTSATATMTASSASISATNSFVAGQQVQFANQGGVLPAGFTLSNNYFVLAAGLSGSAFQVAPTLNGPAITVGAGGTGTQKVVSTTSLALNGTLVNASGVVVLDTPRRILITTTDTTTKFTINGTSPSGSFLTETFLVVGGATYSNLDYATVTSITLSQGTTAAVTAGTNGIASSLWVRFDDWANTQVTIQCNVSGNCNYTVQSSMDDTDTVFATPVLPSAVAWVASNDLTVVNAATTQQSNWMFAPVYARVLMNSGNGTVTATFVQSHSVAY